MRHLAKDVVHGSATVSHRQETEGVLGAERMRVSQVSYVKSYMQKSIRGTGEVQLQYCYRADKQIEFTGYEVFSGQIGDIQGSIIFSLVGTVDSKQGVESGQIMVGEGAGTGPLSTLSGNGTYVLKGVICSFEFENIT